MNPFGSRYLFTMNITMEIIAKKVGLSRNAVSLAFRSHPSIPEATRKRILDTAKELGYRRNSAHGELMSQLRRKGHGSTLSTLGLINANQDVKAFTQHPTLPPYVSGCRCRAKELGYSLNSFWLHKPGLEPRRWIEIFETRNIRGFIIIGLLNQNRIPEFFLPVIEHFPTVVTGVRTRDPALSFACVDHHMLMVKAFEKALELGYKKPGLVLDSTIDQLVECRFSSGYRCAQLALPRSKRVTPFMDIDTARTSLEHFLLWIQKHRPDVIFTLYNEVYDWLGRLGFRVPDDIGLVQLEWRKQNPEWAGMNQHNDITGEAAMDMLIGKIHRGEKSIMDFPRATLIGPTWVDGKTVLRKKV